MKYPSIAAHVGYQGGNVWLDPLRPYEDDDPLVLAKPELFTDTSPSGVEPPKPKRGRPPKRREEVGTKNLTDHS